MRFMTWLAMLTGMVALGFVAAPAQAAPADGLHGLQAPAAQSGGVQKADWYRHHHRRYYYYGPRYHYGYGPRYHRHWHHRHYRHYRSW